MITFTGPEFEYSIRVDNGRGPLIGRVKYKLHDSIDYIEEYLTVQNQVSGQENTLHSTCYT